jgi:tRNA (guanine37-N1)-methyltransferase
MAKPIPAKAGAFAYSCCSSSVKGTLPAYFRSKSSLISRFLCICAAEPSVRGFSRPCRETRNQERETCMISFDILTLFPKLCAGAFADSILRKAQENLLIQVRCLNIRDWSTDKHHVTDEPPYGGGPGMVMKPEPIFAAVESIRTERSHVILMAPGGRRFTQEIAGELSRKEHLIFVCGHYEGIDHRVSEHLADDELSIGDYVVSNGAIAAAVIVDAVARLIPGVLGEGASTLDESFSSGLLEYPQYTRPSDFRGWKVPDILLSGNHRAIRVWRETQALRKTEERRPDLLEG